ncbi:hypothetical protein PoB_006731700 [Plakobranchus ocellatus]|uniref:Uncharacterized protein n=1 Tax=Plakobranchus ocellatus TaxID=259542 RepID=A0AAV4D9I1_9GAST|nr:hypothetical protein PoB_006731700 [Plakobranchus ocellatus]
MATKSLGDLRLSSPPSDQSAGGGIRTLDRRALAYLRTDLLINVSPPSLMLRVNNYMTHKNYAKSRPETEMEIARKGIPRERRDRKKNTG